MTMESHTFMKPYISLVDESCMYKDRSGPPLAHLYLVLRNNNHILDRINYPLDKVEH